MSVNGHDVDVVVIGGGPAGSSTASRVARAGRRVLLLERDRFPRFHIGESLLSSVNDSLEEIGALELVQRHGFIAKWGATFGTGDGTFERFADFSVAREVPRPQTWHVPRAEFDALLLKHAADSGADVRQGHRVLDVAFDADGVTVTFRRDDAETARVRARAVVDASGRVGVLARKFRVRMDEPSLANVAVFSHYSGVPRAEGRRAGDIRIVAREDLGWFWLIPISDELMSVGVVLPRAAYDAMPRTTPDALFERAIAETPGVAGLMGTARREWPVRVERDFSFGARTYAGDRWLLVGDAGSFLDPVFSTGVAIALESGVEAGRALEAALASGDLSARAFAVFNRRQRQRYRSFRRFVVAFYTRGFRELFFAPVPPTRIFLALITAFAGYWNPSRATRTWQAIFFTLVWLRNRLPVASRFAETAAGLARARVAAR